MNASAVNGGKGGIRTLLTAAVALTAGVLAGSFLLAGRPVAGTSVERVEDDRVVAARVGGRRCIWTRSGS